MVRRTKSMDQTLKEGQSFLERTGSTTKNIHKSKQTTKSTITKPTRTPSKSEIVQKKKSKSQIISKSHIRKAKKDSEEIEVEDSPPKVKVEKKKKELKKDSPPKKKTEKKVEKKTEKTEKAEKAEKSKKAPESKIIEKKVQPEKKEKKEKLEKKAEPPKERQPQQNPRKSKSMKSVGSDAGKVIHGLVDCVFVVDTTGSMDIYLEKTTDCVQMLMKRVKEQTKTKDVSVRFGFVCYRDHPPQESTYVTQLQDLTNDKEILDYIETLDCFGGGDGAEAALDGLNVAATQINWRDSSKIPSLRYIFHICDQPPHGREFGGFSEEWDDGCPCGLTPDQVIHRINVRQIHYRLIKASSTRLEKFAEIFKANIVNYEEETLEEGVADEMDIKITDMVIRELCPDILYD